MAERYRIRHHDPGASGAAERPVRQEATMSGRRLRTLAIALLAIAGPLAFYTLSGSKLPPEVGD